MEPTTDASIPDLPGRVAPDAAVYVISVAAELAGMHAQTLRSYDGTASSNRPGSRGVIVDTARTISIGWVGSTSGTPTDPPIPG